MNVGSRRNISNDKDELFKVLQSVEDEEALLQFLLTLRDDRETSISLEKANPGSLFGPDTGGWENQRLSDFSTQRFGGREIR